MASSAAPLVKAALFASLTTLFAGQSPPVLVTYGPRGPTTPDDVVSVGNVTTDRGVIAVAPTRPREEFHLVEVLWSVSRSGPETAQQVATERAYALEAILDGWLQTSPNEALGLTPGPAGQLAWATIISSSLTEPVRQTTGRSADLTSTVRVRTRI